MTTDYRAYLAPLGRLFLAVLFFLSGAGKLANPSGTIAYIASSGAPLPAVGLVIAVAIELGVCSFFLLGYKTRTAASILALFCVAAAMMFHHNFADQNQLIHFMKDLAIAGGFLQVTALGAGAFSLDARLSRRKQAAAGSA